MGALPQKACCRCNRGYPASPEFFFKNAPAKDGLTSQCKACRKEMQREQYLRHREDRIARATESARLRRLREDVRERERVTARERKRVKLQCPVAREKHRAQVRQWFRKNLDRVRELPSRDKALRAFYQSMRNAALLRATPPWADLRKISEVYREARRLTLETGVPHEVDHAVPLRHPLASGLHVPANLRVVTRDENRSKSNRFITD